MSPDSPAAGPPPHTAAPTPAPSSGATSPSARRGYAARWRAVPAETGFLLLTMPIAVIGLSVVSSLFFAGLGLIAVVVGVVVVVVALYAARAFGTVELVRLDWSGRPPIERPLWEAAHPGASGWRRVLGPLVDGHYWLALLHTIVVNPIVSIFSWTVTIVWLSIALGGLTGWIWSWIGDGGERAWFGTLLTPFFAVLPGWALLLIENVVWFLLGALFALTLPYVFRGLVLLHWAIAKGMLGRSASDELKAEVERLDASRGAAIRAEDASLRRLERDIHDGPQQRLIRLQMDLAAAERRLDDDPEAARTLLAEARTQTAETLDELRALSRGVAPPLLQDRGLAVALDALAARSPVPVVVEQRARAAQLPPALERNAYFIVAELLTNAAKHSAASAVRLTTATRVDEYGRPWLDLWVGDNGDGGAAVVPGHGLAGLAERTAGLGGILVVDSPAGGPTNVGAHLPIGDGRRVASP